MLTLKLHNWRESAKAKLRGVRGFSLTELMATMIILLLATGLAVQGIPSVIRAYERTVDAANAETYLNTVTIALRNRLSLASWNASDGTYTDPKIGRFQILNDSDKGIQIQEGVGMDTPPPSKPLARSERKSGETEFISSYENIDGSGDFFIVTGLAVTKNGQTEPLAKLDSPYFIRKLNP